MSKERLLELCDIVQVTTCMNDVMGHDDVLELCGLVRDALSQLEAAKRDRDWYEDQRDSALEAIPNPVDPGDVSLGDQIRAALTAANEQISTLTGELRAKDETIAEMVSQQRRELSHRCGCEVNAYGTHVFECQMHAQFSRDAADRESRLRSQLEAAKADSERLDWLEKEMKPYFTSAMHEVANTEHFDGRTVREAIDAARASRAQQGGE